jgi:hypothetical protein
MPYYSSSHSGYELSNRIEGFDGPMPARRYALPALRGGIEVAPLPLSPAFVTQFLTSKACVKCGLGEKTGKAWYQYKGLVPHDFRRSAVRNLVNAGVDTATAMKITGHRTLHIFMRYNIISTGQLSRSYGEGHIEEEGGKVNGNYNACLTQNADVILTELRYLLSYQ